MTADRRHRARATLLEPTCARWVRGDGRRANERDASGAKAAMAGAMAAVADARAAVRPTN